jgi:DnaK suppressor protein
MAGKKKAKKAKKTAAAKNHGSVSKHKKSKGSKVKPSKFMIRRSHKLIIRRSHKADKAPVEDMLLGLRERITGQITALKGDSLQRFDAANTEEDGTDAFERQFALNLVSSEQDALFEIDEALRRLEEGIYGVCLQCRKLIEGPRLKALPFVKMCVKCQSHHEKGRPGFRSDETVAYHAETAEQEESSDGSDSP